MGCMSGRSISALLILTACAAPMTPVAPTADTDVFAIRDVRVFDGTRVVEHANVVVHAGRIAAFARDAPIPDGARTINGADQTLLPGLIDAHVHVFPGAQADALRFGVTAELDMFNLSHEFAKWRAQRGSLAHTREADTWSAGTGVNVAGGHPAELGDPGAGFPALASAADAQAFVDARVAEGSDYIKLLIEDLAEFGEAGAMPTLAPDEVCAVVAAAHHDRKLAIVHVQTLAAAREAMACGANGLAHVFPDAVADQPFAAALKAHHMFVLSTLGVWAAASRAGIGQAIASVPAVARYLSPSQKATMVAVDGHAWPTFFPSALATLRVLHEADVPVLAATDNTGQGVGLHEELQLMVRAGFTPREALHAATALPAQVFSLGDRGQIAVGNRADLVLVRGDPTADIRATLDIVAVWKNGYAIDRTAPPVDPHAQPGTPGS